MYDFKLEPSGGMAEQKLELFNRLAEMEQHFPQLWYHSDSVIAMNSLEERIKYNCQVVVYKDGKWVDQFHSHANAVDENGNYLGRTIGQQLQMDRSALRYKVEKGQRRIYVA